MTYALCQVVLYTLLCLHIGSVRAGHLLCIFADRLSY